ncbi:uncharacterized protein [Apteryx mantelli]|uniref:Uncharacterized protein n=1 Tax=Apteryx mantelli TaxID=2696672 RepID=A0ABM4F452_9AVES
MGILVPFRPPAWEEDGRYEELYERHSQCDAGQCLHREGRQQAEESGPQGTARAVRPRHQQPARSGGILRLRYTLQLGAGCGQAQHKQPGRIRVILGLHYTLHIRVGLGHLPNQQPGQIRVVFYLRLLRAAPRQDGQGQSDGQDAPGYSAGHNILTAGPEHPAGRAVGQPQQRHHSPAPCRIKVPPNLNGAGRSHFSSLPSSSVAFLGGWFRGGHRRGSVLTSCWQDLPQTWRAPCPRASGLAGLRRPAGLRRSQGRVLGAAEPGKSRASFAGQEQFAVLVTGCPCSTLAFWPCSLGSPGPRGLGGSCRAPLARMAHSPRAQGERASHVQPLAVEHSTSLPALPQAPRPRGGALRTPGASGTRRAAGPGP